MSSYWNYRECYDAEHVMGGTPDDDPRFVTAYTFEPGYEQQATNMFRWLQHDNLSPKWGGAGEILLSEADLVSLRVMQANNPARYGTPPKPNGSDDHE
jgi:hypothetical protein